MANPKEHACFPPGACGLLLLEGPRFSMEASTRRHLVTQFGLIPSALLAVGGEARTAGMCVCVRLCPCVCLLALLG